MRIVYPIYDRSKGEKWAFCSTYTNHQEALERLRSEARGVPSDDQLVYLSSTRLKTLSGYEMRIEAMQIDEPAPVPTSFDQFVESPEAPCLCSAPRNADGRCSIPDCVQNPDPYLCSAGCGATSNWEHLPECANYIQARI